MICALLCTLLLNATKADARWADTSEVTAVTNFTHYKIKVAKDGSATTTTETQTEIMKDSARDADGLWRFTYDSSTSKLKIIEAKTINKDGTFEVPQNDREDKPLASRGAGFDVINQVTIGFPRVNVGSKLYLKTEEQESRASIPGYYFSVRAMMYRSYQQLTLDIESEIPLDFNIFDPEHFLKTKISDKKIHIELKRPYYKYIVEEPDESSDPSKFVWFAVSSAKNWSDFPNATLEAYENDLNSTLPKTYKAIADKAKQKTTPTDQINVVTSEVASQIRYVGEWKDLEGLWHPRSLETITKSGFGDCKDFSLSTGAILRTLGYDTHVAWVIRRREHQEAPLDSKVLRVNHAIIRAEKDGKVYWIDPTNITSQAQNIYDDIADRITYVLYKDTMKLDRTPKMESSQGEIKFKTTIDFKNWKAEGVAEFKGRSAESWTGYELRYDKKAIDYSLVGWVTDRSKVIDWCVGKYDLTSRIVKDISIPFSYSLIQTTEQTTSGPGYEIKAPYWVDHFRARRNNRVSDLLLANPQQMNREFLIKGRETNLTKPVKCEGDSPWAAFKREITKTDDGLKLEDHIEIKTLIVKAKDVQTDQFAKFQAKILDCMQETIIVFKPD